MSENHPAFLTEVLGKVARRYERRGKLSGVMKTGTSIGHDKIRSLHDFFGIEPIRINGREEVRIHFDRALQHMPEHEWVERISSHLGYKLRPVDNRDRSQAVETLISRLKLGYPDLELLTDSLTESIDTLERLFKTQNEPQVTKLCFQLADIVRFLLNNTSPVTVSELGAHYLGDSKLLRQGEMRTLLLEWLQFYCLDLDVEANSEQIFATFHVYHDRLTVNGVIYGPVIYTKNGREFDWIYKLHQQGEPATLSWANLQDIEKMVCHSSDTNPPDLICCENEAPFSQLMRQHSGNCLLFTNGFPGSAVRKIYQFLAPQSGSCLHWGDTDPNGLYIASLLHAIHPLRLFRCDLETTRQHKKYLRPLNHRQQQRALSILISNHCFPFREELAYALENGWLEQENWRHDL